MLYPHYFSYELPKVTEAMHAHFHSLLEATNRTEKTIAISTNGLLLKWFICYRLHSHVQTLDKFQSKLFTLFNLPLSTNWNKLCHYYCMKIIIARAKQFYVFQTIFISNRVTNKLMNLIPHKAKTIKQISIT